MYICFNNCQKFVKRYKSNNHQYPHRIQYSLSKPHFIKDIIIQLSKNQFFGLIQQCHLNIHDYHSNNQIYFSQQQFNKSQLIHSPKQFRSRQQSYNLILFPNILKTVEKFEVSFIFTKYMQQMASDGQQQAVLEAILSDIGIEGLDITTRINSQAVYQKILNLYWNIMSSNKVCQATCLGLLLGQYLVKINHYQQAYQIYKIILQKQKDNKYNENLIKILLTNTYFNSQVFPYPSSIKPTLCKQILANQNQTYEDICKIFIQFIQQLQASPQANIIFIHYFAGLRHLIGYDNTGFWILEFTKVVLGCIITGKFYYEDKQEFSKIFESFYNFIFDKHDHNITPFYLEQILKLIMNRICSKDYPQQLLKNKTIYILLRVAQKLFSLQYKLTISLNIWFNLLKIQSIMQDAYKSTKQVKFTETILSYNKNIILENQDPQTIQFPSQIKISKNSQYSIKTLQFLNKYPHVSLSKNSNLINKLQQLFLQHALTNQQNYIQFLKFNQQYNQQHQHDTQYCIEAMYIRLLTHHKFDTKIQAMLRYANEYTFIKIQQYLQKGWKQQEIYLEKFVFQQIQNIKYQYLKNQQQQKLRNKQQYYQILIIHATYLINSTNTKSLIKQLFQVIMTQPIDFNFKYLYNLMKQFQSKYQQLEQMLRNWLKDIMDCRSINKREYFCKMIFRNKLSKMLIIAYLIQQESKLANKQNKNTKYYDHGINLDTIQQKIKEQASLTGNKFTQNNKYDKLNHGYFQQLFIIILFLQPSIPNQLQFTTFNNPLHILLILTKQRSIANEPLQNNDLIEFLITYMDHSDIHTQKLALLLFLYFIDSRIHWFQSIIYQLVMAQEPIKRKYTFVRFGNQTIKAILSTKNKLHQFEQLNSSHPPNSMNNQTKYLTSSIYDYHQKIGLILIDKQLNDTVQQIFFTKLLEPKEFIRQLIKKPNMNNVLRKVDQLQKKVSKQEHQYRQSINQKLQKKSINTYDAIVSTPKKTTAKIQSVSKKKNSSNPNKMKDGLIVKLTSSEKKRKNYLIRVNDLKKSWNKMLNDIHKIN